MKRNYSLIQFIPSLLPTSRYFLYIAKIHPNGWDPKIPEKVSAKSHSVCQATVKLSVSTYNLLIKYINYFQQTSRIASPRRLSRDERTSSGYLFCCVPTPPLCCLRDADHRFRRGSYPLQCPSDNSETRN